MKTSKDKLVSFDSRSVVVKGQHLILISGEIHYARSPRLLWPDLLRRSKACGLNCIASYVFWNVHEPLKDKFDFSGERDLGHFLRLCQDNGLYVILRLGPYCCAEWNFGGFPSYLREEPGLVTRTWNKPYLQRVEKYFRHLVPVIRSFLASAGGPVILAQVENEYANVSSRYGPDGQRYLRWIVSLAHRLGVDIPTITCEGGAPGAIECLNGFSIGKKRVSQHRRSSPTQPLIWTENYSAWYDTWPLQRHYRDPRNMAFWLLDFIAAGGAGWNYYMWHGGTNFGRTSMYLQITSYDFDSPLDEDGRITLKAEYLGILHSVLQEHSRFLLEGKAKTRKVGADILLTIWEREGVKLILERNFSRMSARLSKDRRVLFDTRRNFQNARLRHQTPPWRKLPLPQAWRSWVEPLPKQRKDGKQSDEPTEQLSLTKDASDYCWYSTTIQVSNTGLHEILIPGGGDFFYIYCNGTLLAKTESSLLENRGSIAPQDRSAAFDVHNPAFAINALEVSEVRGFEHRFSVTLPKGRHQLDILSVALGMVKGDWQISASMNLERKGIWDGVKFDGIDLRGWTMLPGMVGEHLGLARFTESVAWTKNCLGKPLTWHKFDWNVDPAFLNNNVDFRVDCVGLGKGMLFINGRMLGRYWLVRGVGYGQDEPFHDVKKHGLILAPKNQPTQRYYRIPRSWIKRINRLVIFEEQSLPPAKMTVEVRMWQKAPSGGNPQVSKTQK